jgi:hypothetical protein
VNIRFSLRIFLLVLVSLAIFWASPAAARLFPPVQNVHHDLDNDYTITYWVTDPVSGEIIAGTWAINQGINRKIISVQLDSGVLTWTATYQTESNSPLTYEVHYRIYDPSRGVWREGSWADGYWIYDLIYSPFQPPFQYYRHLVKDGVVTWNACRLANTVEAEKTVFFATYDPQLGSWVRSEHKWVDRIPRKLEVEFLAAKNGVVAWIESSLLQEFSVLGAVIYDYEEHKWEPTYQSVNPSVEAVVYDIPDDAVQLRITYFNPFQHESFLSYDAYDHQWIPLSSDIIRRAFFVAYPTSGVVPFRVWFWDCSTAMDGVPTPSAWSWDVAPGVTLTDRSPSYLYSSPGQFNVTEKTFYNAIAPVWSCTGLINALPATRPGGGIAINNGATYTALANVTLSLNHTPDATEMCFQQAPGLFLWGNWEPVADSKAYTLASLSTLGGTPDGLHTVSVKFRDQYNTESLVSTASITLDVTPPAVFLTLNNGAATTTDPNVRVQWSASDAIGIKQMSYAALNQGDTKYIWSPPINFNPPVLAYRPTTSTIKFNTKPGRKTVMVRFTDIAGNVSQAQTSIQFKPASLPFLPLLLGN